MEMGRSREAISRSNSHSPFARSTHSLSRTCSISPLTLSNSPLPPPLLPLPTLQSYSSSESFEEEEEESDEDVEYFEDDDEEPVQFRNPWEAGNPLIDDEEEAWWCVYLNRRADGDLPTRLGQLTEQRRLTKKRLQAEVSKDTVPHYSFAISIPPSALDYALADNRAD
ncbi:hypothetical protein HYALB_00003170 [Hymenoscyphus albidus]|uniref:Uncharacterized protein n=1 Tax=Hymenoscyphus albidus TaxID=595503 RepID=A0A9N9Q1S7_9HELO|nr:hypothetical protein HYALB_00003170 [Hymenoscyphus albidus]